ncbi:zinc finger protein 37-like isoform X14 [Aricia agestis]|uniref:zinc finger protein 37-like isoform X14 n=1 Tax=Aricia agestis TaxID=91739 RepID=UPI001C204B38|nr:zinc finger protein 37-like isoform X14 [Aricia agestis]
MEPKTIEWRPGPAVCRCCLAEGCYKDISTEYFWMGKREVYAEMLSETLDLSIAYSTSGGPNSNSRLICEQCISKLRDATEFKRQVQECERTFIQWLDPGNSVADATATEVKLEQVKKEKNHNSDEDDDFNDQPDFGDDDGYDDLDDDVPLTKYASKTPKKEPVDLQDLLDNVKPTTKRKSTTTKDKSTAKKAKVSKEKATSSKPKPEKKKKGSDGLTISKPSIKIEWKKKQTEEKANAENILKYSNAVPFRWTRGKFLCAYCCTVCVDVSELRAHSHQHHKLDIFNSTVIRPYFPLRIDITDLKCNICNIPIASITDLKTHLSEEHLTNFNPNSGDGVMPFVLTKKEFHCLNCGVLCESFMKLLVHMNKHYQSFVCHVCGKGYATKHKLVAHQRSHESGEVHCTRCDKVFPNGAVKNRHVAVAHGPKKRYRCPLCGVPFESCHSRLVHLAKEHNQKSEYKCSLCPSVFTSGSSRYAHIRKVHNRKTNF